MSEIIEQPESIVESVILPTEIIGTESQPEIIECKLESIEESNLENGSESETEIVLVIEVVKKSRQVPGALRRSKEYYAEYYRKNLSSKLNCPLCNCIVGMQKMKKHQKTKKCMQFSSYRKSLDTDIIA